MKKIIITIIVLLVLFLLFLFLYFQFSSCGIAPWSCGDYTMNDSAVTQRISVGDGPEDMAIDRSSGRTKIIVSCTNRRKKVQEKRGFYIIDPIDNSSEEMTVLPAKLSIFPHGIDVVTIDSIPYLYAISHHGNDIHTQHKIFRFIIKRDSLIQDEDFTLEDEILTGPNDIDVLEDGSFYVSNPMPNNNPNESTKAILGIKNGTVLHYDGNGNWTTVLKDMCYPNGVWFDHKASQLVVANGGCKAVERFPVENGKVNVDKKLSTAKHNIDIPIGDNLMMDEHGVLWTAAHPCPLKFLSHIKDSNQKSPMQIFAIDPQTMKVNLAFQDNGELISAASTALRIDNRLYISQVFDPFVLVIDGINF